MPNSIDPDRFSGHKGYIVEDNPNEGVSGELDPMDVVRQLTRDKGVKGLVDDGDHLGEPVAWDDPGYAAARIDFHDQSSQIAQAMDTIGTLEAAYKAHLADGLAKPPESSVQALASRAVTFAESDAAPALRGEAHLVAAGAFGMIARAYRSGRFGKIGPGKAAFKNLKLATQVGRNNPKSWSRFGMTLLGMELAMANMSGAIRGLLRLAGVNLNRDVPNVIKGLVRFPNDPESLVVLAALLTARGDHMTQVERDLKAEVTPRIVELRQSDPDGIFKAERAIDKIREAVAREG